MEPATATASSVVGEGGNPNTDIPVDPWPSDHRGLVSTFDVTPAPMPLLAAVESRGLEQGEALRVRFHARRGWDVSLLRLGDAISSASKSTGGAADPCSAGYCGNGHHLVYGYTHAAIQGSKTFRPEDWLAGWKTAPLPNGTYEIRLLVDDGYSSVTSSPRFKIVAS